MIPTKSITRQISDSIGSEYKVKKDGVIVVYKINPVTPNQQPAKNKPEKEIFANISETNKKIYSDKQEILDLISSILPDFDCVLCDNSELKFSLPERISNG